MAYTFKHGDRPLEGLTVQRAVGRGGFGEVYYALTDSGKQVALKYLRENPEIELRGIAHVMNLKSPHLITIYDVKQNAAGEPFVIMEYVGGPSLRELLLAQPEGLGPQKAAFFLKGIAAGLSYLHERGIVHRDLKPANIFYEDGYVKIGDYGLSKHMSVSKHSGQTVSVGTVHYMAPEIGSGSYTKAIDIYALGVILYEMLTGRLPYTGASMAEILMRHVRDRPDLAGIPPPFAPVIAQALAKDPHDRYRDADEMLAAVMESAEVSQSVNAFDASALTQIPRSPEAGDADPTRTSPPRPQPVPPLDAREAGWQPAAGIPQPLPARLQRKLDRLHQKLEQKVARLERRFGPARGRPGYPGTPVAIPRARRRSQIFVLLAVTIAIAVVLGFLPGGPSGHGPPRAVALALFMVGGTVGPLLAHLRFLQRSLTRNPLFDRLAYASLAGLFMIPAYMIAATEMHNRDLARTIVAPMAAMVICNWSRRIEAGQSGKVDGWSAFWPGVVGLVAAHVVDAENYAWTAAGLCAAISLLTQAAASMWPIALRPVGPVTLRPVPGAGASPQPIGDVAAGGPPAGAAPDVRVGSPSEPRARANALAAAVGAFVSGIAADSRVGHSSERRVVAESPPNGSARAGATPRSEGWAYAFCVLGFFGVAGIHRFYAGRYGSGLLWLLTAGLLGIGTIVDLFLIPGMIARKNQQLAAAAQLTPAVDHAAPTTAARVPAAPPVIITAAQPSFAGRAASAGVAFLGKLLLLIGLLLALGQSTALEYARKAVTEFGAPVDPDLAGLLERGVPPGVALLPLAFGTLLLVVARRKEGVNHFVRGCLGCGLLLWSALVALLWAGRPLQILFTRGDVPEMHDARMWGPVLMTILSLAVGLFLLLWPSARREKTIVV